MSKARRLALRCNLASWLDYFLPLAAIVAVAAAISLLVLRILRLPLAMLWTALAAGLIVAAGLAWRFARPHLFTSGDALTRFDAIGRLHNRLTAAREGVGEWAAPREVGDGFRWNWPRLFGAIGPALIILIGTAWVDVPNRSARAHPTEPPVAWEQIESWLQTLGQNQLVQAEALEKLRAQMDDLRRQPMEKWYNQASLEASDTLREQTEQALKNMLGDMQTTEEAMTAVAKLDETSTSTELKALNESLQKSLRGLEMGNLPLNKELLNDLKKVDATKLKQISAEQLAEMRAKLKAGVRTAEKCVGPSVRAGNNTVAAQSGGKGGGGSTAPLTLKNEPTNLHTKQTETVTNDDVSHASLGDLVDVNSGKHDVKKNEPKAPVEGGSIQSNGRGGEAVWRDALTPEDLEVLQRFFK
jgi:hypothetical protein